MGRVCETIGRAGYYRGRAPDANRDVLGPSTLGTKGDLPGHEFHGNQWTGGGAAQVNAESGRGLGWPDQSWMKQVTPQEDKAIEAWVRGGSSLKKMRVLDNEGKMNKALESLISGVSKAPVYNGMAMRGLSLTQDEIDQYKVGRTVGFKGLTSFMTNEFVGGVWFAGAEKGKLAVVLRANLKNARSLGYYSNEDEVLIRRASFTVKAVTVHKDKVVVDLD